MPSKLCVMRWRSRCEWRGRGNGRGVGSLTFSLTSTADAAPKAVFTLVTASVFFDDVKEWFGLFFDTHQLGVMLNFDVDVKILLSRSTFLMLTVPT